MALIGVGGPKGSPGATTTAVMLGAWWPRPVAIVEADPDGGVLAIRYGLNGQPGLLELAGNGRNSRLVGFESMLSCAQRACEGAVPIVVAPDNPDTVANALRSDGPALGEWCSGLVDGDVIVDLGRIAPTAPAWALAVRCDLVLVCARPVADQLQIAAARAARLQNAGVSTSLVLVGAGPYSAVDVDRVYGPKLGVSAVLPDDGAGAAALNGTVTKRTLRKSPLLREGRRLTDLLVGWAHPATEELAADAVSDPVDNGTVSKRRRFGRGKRTETPGVDTDTEPVVPGNGSGTGPVTVLVDCVDGEARP